MDNLSNYIKQILDVEKQRSALEMMTRQSNICMANEIQLRQQYYIESMDRSMIHPELNYLLTINTLNPNVSGLYDQIYRDINQKNIENMYSTLGLLGHSHSALMNDLLRSHQRIRNAQELIAVRHINITTAHHIESILSALEASARAYTNNLWSPALLNAHAYQHFAEKQVNRLLKENYRVARQRAIVTNMCGDIAQRCQSAFEIGLAISGGEKQIISPIPKPNIYGMINQSLSFIYHPGADYDAQDVLEDALPSRIIKLGIGIILAVYQINESAQRRNMSVIFKHTNKTMIACALIPTRIARSREDFEIIVDNLFFLLYEGSGSDNSRLCNMANDEILEPIWRLKHLRLDLRHDIDHGKDAKKNYLKIAAAYSSLIKKEIPTKSKDWSEAQYSIYNQLLNMLNEIIIVQETSDLPK